MPGLYVTPVKQMNTATIGPIPVPVCYTCEAKEHSHYRPDARPVCYTCEANEHSHYRPDTRACMLHL